MHGVSVRLWFCEKVEIFEIRIQPVVPLTTKVYEIPGGQSRDHAVDDIQC